MANPQPDKRSLYDAFKAKGLNIGTYEEFESTLANDEDRKWYHDKATQFGLNVGTYNDFDAAYNPAKAQAQAAPASAASQSQASTSQQAQAAPATAPANQGTQASQQSAAPASAPAPEPPAPKFDKGNIVKVGNKLYRIDGFENGQAIVYGDGDNGQSRMSIEQLNGGSLHAVRQKPLTEQEKNRMQAEMFGIMQDGKDRMQAITEQGRRATEYQTQMRGGLGGRGFGGGFAQQGDAVKYGKVMQNGKLVDQYLLPNGMVTTSATDVALNNTYQRQVRMQHRFESRMKARGLDPTKEEDVQAQLQWEAQEPMRRAIRDIWSEAEAQERQHDEEYTQQLVENRKPTFRNIMEAMATHGGGAGGMMETPSDQQARLKRATQRHQTYNLDNMAQAAYDRLPAEYKQAVAAYFEQNPSELPKGMTVQQAVEQTIKADAYQQFYGKAVQMQMPKSDLEFFLRKVVDNPFINPNWGMNLAAASQAQSFGLNIAEEEGMNRYQQSRGGWGTALGIGGTVVGMALDPTTYISGGVGSWAGETALKGVAKRGMRKMATSVGERYLLGTLAGRTLQGIVSGSFNFGTYEFLSNIQDQAYTGGTVDAGGHSHGFQWNDALSAGSHGLILGAATGAVAPLLGNEADKAVSKATSVEGKVGIRAGELATSMALESTIFSSPEFLSLAFANHDDFVKERTDAGMSKADAEKAWNSRGQQAWDIWTDNLAMVLGFKVQHGIKSVKTTLGELEQSGKSLQEVIVDRMNASPSDLYLNKDEKAELDRAGYSDIAEMLHKKPHEGKIRVVRTGDGLMSMRYDDGTPYNPKLRGYKEMQKLMADNNISQAARAKAYYLVTGHKLPPISIMGYRVTTSDDGIFVQTLSEGGEVITNKSFKTEEAAMQYANDVCVPTIERNAIAYGEQVRAQAAGQVVVQNALEDVAASKSRKLEQVQDIYQRGMAGEELNKGEMTIFHAIEDAMQAHMEDGREVSAESIRSRVEEETGVNLADALKKAKNSRTSFEQEAIEAYTKALYPEQKETEADNAQGLADEIKQEGKDAFNAMEVGDALSQEQVNAIAQRYVDSRRQAEISLGNHANEMLDQLDTDPWNFLESAELTDEQYMVAMDYLNAKAAMDGVKEAQAESVEQKKDAVARQVSSRTAGDGMIHPAVMKLNDRKVYVVSGEVAMHPDGSMVDMTKSDHDIYVVDAETGEVELTSPDQILRTEEAVHPQTELDNAYQQIEAESAARMPATDGMPFKAGDVVSMEMEGKRVVASVDEVKQDGTVRVSVQDEQGNVTRFDTDVEMMQDYYNAEPYTEEMRQAAEAAAQNPAAQAAVEEPAREGGRVSGDNVSPEADAVPASPAVPAESKYGQKGEVTFNNGTLGLVTGRRDAEGKVAVYLNGREGTPGEVKYFTEDELDNLVREYRPDKVEEAAVSEAQSSIVDNSEMPAEGGRVEAAPATAENPAAKESVLERIPKDDNGEADFLKADPAMAYDGIVEALGGKAEKAVEIINDEIVERQAVVDELSQRPKPKGVNAKIKAEQELNAAQAALDHYKNILAEHERRQAEAARVEAAEPAPATEEVKAEETPAEHIGEANEMIEAAPASTEMPKAEGDTELAPQAEATPAPAELPADAPLSQRIAAAESQTETNPTEAQKRSGNYKKGKVKVGTHTVTIENPRGSMRRGTDANGKEWETQMQNTYGYINGTEGVDGDHIDVFLNSDIDNWDGQSVFVVDQYKPDGSFDEHKVMMGFNSAEEAKKAYLANYEKGWENGRRLEVSSVSSADFDKWVGSSHRKTKPFAEYNMAGRTTEKIAPSSEGGKAEDTNPARRERVEVLKEVLHTNGIPVADVTNEQALRAAGLTDKELTANASVFGWTQDGRIYLNKDKISPSTPLHEFTHLWNEMAKAKNPEFWKRLTELMKETDLYRQVERDPNYSDLKGDVDAIVDEAFSVYVEGGDKALRDMIEAAKERGTLETAKAVTLAERIKEMAQEWWGMVKDVLSQWTGQDLSDLTLEEAREMVLHDLFTGRNPMREMQAKKAEEAMFAPDGIVANQLRNAVDLAPKPADGKPLFNIRSEADVAEQLRDHLRQLRDAELKKKPKKRDKHLAGWTDEKIESIIEETQSLINLIHDSLEGNPRYDEWAKKEPTLRVDWRDGELRPTVTWSRNNVEYKYDASADLLCINNEGMESILASPDMVELMMTIDTMGREGYNASDYMRLYEVMRDLGLNVPCKGCFDAAARLKMLPSMSKKFTDLVNSIIDERNADPAAFDAEVRSMKSKEYSPDGIPLSASTKEQAIRQAIIGDNLTEHIDFTQLMSAEGQTKALADWGGIFRAWQRGGSGKPKDKLLPEPYIGDLTTEMATIIAPFGSKTPSYRDIDVNQGTGLRRNSHSEFRPLLAIDEIQFMRDAYAKGLCVFKYMKELDDVRLFGKLGIKFNMSFFPAFDKKSPVAGLDANGNYIASEESVGSREYIYTDENGKQHFDGMRGLEEAEKYVNKDVSLSSVIFSIPHLIKALTDVPTPSDRAGRWGSLIPFHSSGATKAQLAHQGLGIARAAMPGQFKDEAFSDYGKGVTNFEDVQNDRFGEGWIRMGMEGKKKKKDEDVPYGYKLEFKTCTHYFNKNTGVHLFPSFYVREADIKPEHIEGFLADDKATVKAVRQYAGHDYSIDYNDKVRELGDDYAYKGAADHYLQFLPELGLIPRFDFNVPEATFLQMCADAHVDPRHPKLGWKGEGHGWSPVDAESYYSLFCDYGMTDPETGKYAPHNPVGIMNENGEREFRLPENAVDIIKEGVARFSEMRDYEDSMHNAVMNEYVKRSVADGRLTQEQADAFLAKPKFSIRTYHGSHADFDGFDHSHMGEGQASQSFGWGTYVTSSEEIGRDYAESSVRENDRVQFYLVEAYPTKESYRESQRSFYEHMANESRKRIENLEGYLAEADTESGRASLTEAIASKRRILEDTQAVVDRMASGDYTKEDSTWENVKRAKDEYEEGIKGRRNLYEVDIPEDKGNNYLSWYDHYDEAQIKDIYDRIEKALRDNGFNVDEFPNDYDWNQSRYADMNDYAGRATGERIYRNLVDTFEDPQTASLMLSEAGFSGIKYPAGTIYGNGRGATNYVIFREADAKITNHTRFRITSESSEEEKRMYKTAQSQIIREANPMQDDYHTGIRSAEDIKTFDEILESAEQEGSVMYPDMSVEDLRKAKGTGMITVYSSKPIENGVFVSPSRMNAKDYAGEGRVYSKEVHVEDVAWIDDSEGQMAQVAEIPAMERPADLDMAEEESSARFSITTDPADLALFEDGKTIDVYRMVQMPDPKGVDTYPPMSGKVDGEWREPTPLGAVEKADERPDLAFQKKGKEGDDYPWYFTLDKGNGTTVDALYNSYLHTSRSLINDQFSSAWMRPELYTVVSKIPVSELTSGYKGEKCNDSVGEMQWKSGPISGALAKVGDPRLVILSRWAKNEKVVPLDEVAAEWERKLKPYNIGIPFNVIPPNLREPLLARGLRIIEPQKGNAGDAALDAYREWAGLPDFDSRDKETIARRAEELAALHGVDVRVINDIEEIKQLHSYQMLPDKSRAAMLKKEGWYDADTHQVIAVLPNLEHTADVESLVFTEAHGRSEAELRHYEQTRDTNPAHIQAKAMELGETLHTPIRMASEEEAAGRGRGRKAWMEDGTLVLDPAKHGNVAEAERTVLREAVAAKGLKELVGEDGYTPFVKNLYTAADKRITEVIDAATNEKVEAEYLRLREQYGDGALSAAKARTEAEAMRESLRIEATEDYLRDVVERAGMEGFRSLNEAEQTFWPKVRERITKMLTSAKLPKSYTDVLHDRDILGILGVGYARQKANGTGYFAEAEVNEARRKMEYDKELTAEDVAASILSDAPRFSIRTPEQEEADKRMFARVEQIEEIMRPHHANKKAVTWNDVKGQLEAIANEGVSSLREAAYLSEALGYRHRMFLNALGKNPAMDFLGRHMSKDKSVYADFAEALKEFSFDERDLDALDHLTADLASQANMDYNSPRGATKLIKMVNTRINELKSEVMGGRDLGIKSGETTLEEVDKLFNDLNTDESVAALYQRVRTAIDRIYAKGKPALILSFKEFNGNNTGDHTVGVIRYRTSTMNDAGVSNQFKASLLLHELIHGLTSAAFDIHPSALPENVREGVSAIRAIYNQALMDSDFKGAYGIKNIHEFCSELANPTFRGKLREKGLWQYIIDAFKSILGLKTDTSTNTLEAAEAALDYLMETESPDLVAVYNGSINTSTRREHANSRDASMRVYGREGKQWDEVLRKGTAASFASAYTSQPRFHIGGSLEQEITDGAIDMATRHANDLGMRNAAYKAIGGNLSHLRKAMGAQRLFDLRTVKDVTDLAQRLLTSGLLYETTPGEMKRLLSAVKNSLGHITKDKATGEERATGGVKNVEEQVQKIYDIMVTSQIRAAEDSWKKLLHLKGKKVNAMGVEVQGQLDVHGQAVQDALKRVIADDLPLSAIQTMKADALSRMSDPRKVIAEQAALEYDAYDFAERYTDAVADAKENEANLRQTLRGAEADYKAGRMTKTAYDQLVQATEAQIRQVRIDRAEDTRDLVFRFAQYMQGSIDAARQFRQAEKDRILGIQHNANSDLEGLPFDEHREDTAWQKTMASSPVQVLTQSLPSFDAMLRLFSPKSANGEGYLWNRFMRGYVEASGNERQGYNASMKVLDEKAKEIFGCSFKDAALKVRNMKLANGKTTHTVSFWNGGGMQDHEITSSELAYIYMVNKMEDGIVKLRRMGIEEADVEAVKDALDPRIIEWCDWLQDEFFVNSRERYNEVHKRMFGASMAAIENYVPLKILDTVIDREVDTANLGNDPKSSTTTGSIIKRKRNNKALDILHADIFNVVNQHVMDMEHWAAFSEFSRDINTLLSYNRFRNKVRNMASIYGAGNQLLKRFETVCSIATGDYRGKAGNVDKAALNLVKLASTSKVAFRLYTAFKQLSSMPAFFPEVSAGNFVHSFINPKGSFEWALENLPLFEKRWLGRAAGNEKLLPTDIDWKWTHEKWAENLSKWGLTTNAFVDALTVAIGARSIYETRKSRYIKEGYTDADADRKAKQDATILYNKSQQSSENAFMSEFQVARTWYSTIFSVFRNSPMSYQRMVAESMRGMSRKFKGNKNEMIEFAAKQIMRDWGYEDFDSDALPDGSQYGNRTADQNRDLAMRAAKRQYRKSWTKDVANLATYGFVMQFFWNLFGKLPYLIAGSDDEEKKEEMYDILKHSAIGGQVEGLVGGDVISDGINAALSDEGLTASNFTKDMPFATDVQRIAKKLTKDDPDYVEATNDILNALLSTSLGVNPQTASDACVAIWDACQGDVQTAHEVSFMLMRIAQCPQSQLDKICFDELDCTAEQAKQFTPAEVARRYAAYKVMRGSALDHWMYSEEGEEKAMTKREGQYRTELKERTNKLWSNEVNDAYATAEETYKGFSQRQTALRNEAKAGTRPYDEISQEAANLTTEQGFQAYQAFKAFNTHFNKLVNGYLDAETPADAERYRQAIIYFKPKMMEVVNEADHNEQMRKAGELSQWLSQFYNPSTPSNR